MKKYKVEVRQYVDIVLEVDERITPDDEWRSVFYKMYSLEALVEHIAWSLANFGEKSFVEGVGTVGEYNVEHKTGGFKLVSMDKEWDIESCKEIE